jgi:hypothetical protein
MKKYLGPKVFSSVAYILDKILATVNYDPDTTALTVSRVMCNPEKKIWDQKGHE